MFPITVAPIIGFRPAPEITPETITRVPTAQELTASAR